MQLNLYQEKAMETAIFKSPLYPVLALCEEVGEVHGKIAKSLRGDGPLDMEGLKLELGDVFWQFAAVCDVYGFTLEQVARANLKKLADRKERNVLSGSGDKR